VVAASPSRTLSNTERMAWISDSAWAFIVVVGPNVHGRKCGRRRGTRACSLVISWGHKMEASTSGGKLRWDLIAGRWGNTGVVVTLVSVAPTAQSGSSESGDEMVGTGCPAA
jgi:hypothetical protein